MMHDDGTHHRGHAAVEIQDRQCLRVPSLFWRARQNIANSALKCSFGVCPYGQAITRLTLN